MTATPDPSPIDELPEEARKDLLESLYSKYAELLANLDDFQRRVRSHYGEQITCMSGCFSCCKSRLSVFALEAEGIRRGVAQMSDELRGRLAARLDNDWGVLADYCPFLLEGSCSVYSHRPLLCRVHGLPNSSTSYPAGSIEFCELNFKDFDIEQIKPEAVLDWDHIGHLLALLNYKFTQIQGRERLGRLRIPLVELAREAVGLDPDPTEEEDTK